MAAVLNDAIYLDHNATSPVFPEVVEAMRACWNEPYLNPASQHEFGRRARRILEDARDRIGELLGVGNHDRVILTSGGTESNNLAICGLIRSTVGTAHATPPPHLVISTIEHPSITTVAAYLSAAGCEVDDLAVDANCVVRTNNLPTLLRPETRCVAVMLANNETGVVQPIADLAKICRLRNIPLHTDASQAAGKLSTSFSELSVATMTIAAHKFGGPLGIGALIVRHDVELGPVLHGGVQQSGLRPGTEPVALAVGMVAALELWQNNRLDWAAHLQSMRDEFEASLRRQVTGVKILGQKVDRLPSTSNIAFVGFDRQALLLALDQSGVACSTGSACASGSSEPSPVHMAMGCEPDVISSALRFSFGVQTTVAEIGEAVNRITRICNNLRREKLR